MPLVKVKTKYQVTLPHAVRQQLPVGVGDLLEAKVEKGKITLAPKVVLDRPAADEYTPPQRRIINARIAEGMEDFRKGRFHGPFTGQEAVRFLKSQVKRPAAKSIKPAR